MNARSRAAPVTGQASTSYPQPENERSLRSVEEAARSCRACDLWKSGTQTVFGAGPRSASVMFIGEQPGDQEDRAGEPFVGPAGPVLDAGLIAAGDHRDLRYVTNTGKHFNRNPHGKRHIHP